MASDERLVTAKAGFALIDALTALALLATVLSFSLGVANISRRLAIRAAETREIAALVPYLSEIPLAGTTSGSGKLGTFDWSANIANGPPMGPQQAALCQRTIMIRARASGRSATATRVQACPREAMA